MRRAFGIATAAALALSVSVFAQDATKKPAPDATKKPPAEHNMTGCVQKGATEKQGVLTNTAGKGPKLIGVVESTANLAPHAGHQIEITGVNVPVAEAEAMKPAPPKADHYMKITNIKMVAATCPS